MAVSKLLQYLPNMFGQFLWIGIITAIVIVLVIFFKSNRTSPPCYSGWIPWIGCAIEFGKSPLWFIDQSRKRLGPLFTLKVAGKRLTFVTELEDFNHFFTSPNVDFQKVVQSPVEHAAAVSWASFFKNHTKIHDTVKACLAPNKLQPFSESLYDKFSDQLNLWPVKGEVELHQLIRRTMYISVLDNLFGDHVLPTADKMEYETLEKHFVMYDDQFEYGSQLPEMFVQEWSKSKWWLLGKFRIIADNLIGNDKHENKETVLSKLFETVDRRHAGNYGLLLMWASLANAIPISFWTLAFILSDRRVKEKVHAEIQEVWGDPNTKASTEIVSQMTYIKQCVLEAIRLRSPGVIARMVVKPIVIKGYTIPAGDHLMLSPYWAHRNHKLFPEPETFNPDRWSSVDVDKQQFLEGFVAFGGGRYQCPGRWFALLEMCLLVAMVMKKYDITLLDKVPALGRWSSVDVDKQEFLEGFVAFGGGRYQCPGRWFALLEMSLLVAMVMKKYDITLLDKVPALSPLHLVGTQQPAGKLMVTCNKR